MVSLLGPAPRAPAGMVGTSVPRETSRRSPRPGGGWSTRLAPRRLAASPGPGHARRVAAPHLLHFRVSHYNEKVRWALDHKSIPHTRETLIAGFHIPRVRRLTGQNKVPVLVWDGQALFGSARILEEIEARVPEPRLFPEDPALRRRVDELQVYFDTEVAPAVRRLFWSTYFERPADAARMATAGAGPFVQGVYRLLFPVLRPLMRRNMSADRRSVEEARRRLTGYVDRVEAEIGPSGYLVGERFGVADLAVAAVMTAILRPPEFPYPLPEPWPPALVDLRGSIAERPGSRWVAEIYRRHRGTSSEIPPSR